MKKLTHKNSNFTLSVGYHTVQVDKNGEAVVSDEEALELLRLNVGFVSMENVTNKPKTEVKLSGFEPDETN